MKEGHRKGPYQPFRLREMLEEGTLMPTDSVWHEGMENWQRLEDTESLSAVLNREPAVREETEEEEPKPKPKAPPVLPENPDEILAVLRTRRVLASRRFFARHIDMMLASMVTVGTAAALGIGDVWQMHLPDSIPMLLAPAIVWLLVEPFVLALWGTTPGKAVLGLRVESADGGRISMKQALQRSVLVWAGGMGFGVRAGNILPVAQWGYAWWMLQRRGTTLWDHTARTVVRAVPLRRSHAIGMASAAAIFIAMHVWLTLVPPLPPRIGDEDRIMIEDVRRQIGGGGK